MPSAVLSARRDAGGTLLLVTLLVEPAVAAAYVAPGQYIEVAVPKGAGYFALAGEPGDPAWELLVRSAGGAADDLASLPVGSPLDVSRPLGRGFPLQRAHGRPLVVAAVGSAIAAARPLLRRRIAAGDGRRTVVLLGVRTPDDVPLADEVEQWSEDTEVILCLSRAPEDDHQRFPKAARAPGYVQEELERAVREGRVAEGAMVFAVGPVPMLEALSATAGVQVVTNA
jgi:NAD(P)H-flavin reductase